MVTTRKKTNKKGFTLVELVVVIAILAILAAIAVPTVSNIINTANANVDIANAQTVELALKSAHAEAVGGTWIIASSQTTPNTPAQISDLNVDTALTHEGIPLTTIQSSRSGATWKYLNGKVYCDSATHTSANTLKSDGSDKVVSVIAAP